MDVCYLLLIRSFVLLQIVPLITSYSMVSGEIPTVLISVKPKANESDLYLRPKR